jgi:uncharacterized protein (DUF488 family)
VADVRSTPYRRFNPQFNQKSLKEFVTQRGMQYFYMGDSLGGRPKDPLCYKRHLVPRHSKDITAEIDYQAVMHRPWFIEGIRALCNLAGHQPTCILCSEKGPTCCHRHQLIAKYLVNQHPEVTTWHILGDGSLINAVEMIKMDIQTITGQLALDI